MTQYEKAHEPEDLTRLFVERANERRRRRARRALRGRCGHGLSAREQTVGRDAIRRFWEQVFANPPRFQARIAASHPGQR